MSTPIWPYRRELYIDARDLQSENSDGTTMSDADYIALLTNRGRTKLAEHQLTKCFEAEVRQRGATYELGKDYELGDTITVIDDTLGVTANAVVQSATHSVDQNGENTELTFGFGQPTIQDVINRERT